MAPLAGTTLPASNLARSLLTTAPALRSLHPALAPLALAGAAARRAGRPVHRCKLDSAARPGVQPLGRNAHVGDCRTRSRIGRDECVPSRGHRRGSTHAHSSRTARSAQPRTARPPSPPATAGDRPPSRRATGAGVGLHTVVHLDVRRGTLMGNPHPRHPRRRVRPHPLSATTTGHATPTCRTVQRPRGRAPRPDRAAETRRHHTTRNAAARTAAGRPAGCPGRR